MKESKQRPEFEPQHAAAMRVELSSIEVVANVNRLLAKQQLKFADAGLTVISW